MQQQIDDELQRVADWLIAFQPTWETHEDRKAYLMCERDQVTQIVESLGQISDSISQSNIATSQW